MEICSPTTPSFPPSPAPSPRPYQRRYSSTSSCSSTSSSAASSSASSPTSSPLLSFATASSPVISVRSIKSSFQQLSNEEKEELLRVLIECCETRQLTFVSNLISPKLKKDFLKDLPIELSLHILSFIDNPKTLCNAAAVSKYWRSLLKEDSVWKYLCQRSFPLLPPGPSAAHLLLGRSGLLPKFSYKDYIRRRHLINSNWVAGRDQRIFFPFPESGVVTSLQFDADHIVVGSDNHKIQIFDTWSGQWLKTLSGHEGGVWALEFTNTSQNGEKILVSGGCDRDVRVWDINSGKCKHVLRGHTSTVRCLKLRDNTIAVTGSHDYTLRVWDLVKGVSLHTLAGHEGSVRCLDIHGDIVVSGSYDFTARVWDIESGMCLHVLEGHKHQIYAIAFDGLRIVTGSLDRNCRVWDPHTGQCLATLEGHTSLVGQLQLSGSHLVTGGGDGYIRIWDLNTYQEVHNIAATYQQQSVTCLQFDSKHIVSGGNDGSVKLWNLKSGQLIRTLTINNTAIWRIAFNESRVVVLLQRNGQTVMEVIKFDLEECDGMLQC